MRFVVIEIRFIARNEAVIGGEIFEENIVIDTLPIFETAKLNLTRVSFFSLVDNVAIFGNSAVEKFVGTIKLQAPDNVGGILNVAGFFEGFKRNALSIVKTVERADDDESGVGLALKVFKFANNLVNSLLRRNIRIFDRDDLKVVKNEDRSFIFTKGTKFKNQVVDVVFLKFKNVKVKAGRFEVGNNILKRWRGIAAPNTGRS